MCRVFWCEVVIAAAGVVVTFGGFHKWNWGLTDGVVHIWTSVDSVVTGSRIGSRGTPVGDGAPDPSKLNHAQHGSCPTFAFYFAPTSLSHSPFRAAF